MKRFLILVSFLLVAMTAHAQVRSPAELEGLLAPVALQQDAVLWNVLEAAKTPNDVMAAAAAGGSDGPWAPAVRALVPYPELLQRMAESPQWLFDLGNAYLAQPQEVLSAVQVLRQRAAASGHLQTDDAQIVQRYGNVIAVAPVVPAYYVVRYYNPVIVYGPAWRPVRPVYWRPYVVRPAPRNGYPSPAVRMQQHQAVQYRQYHRIPESKRQPIVQQHYRAQYNGKHSGHRRN